MKAISWIGKMVAVMTIMMSVTNLSAADKERRNLNVGDFRELAFSSALNLKLSQGDTYQVVAIGEAKDLNHLTTSVSGNLLRFGRVGRSSGKIEIEIVTPVLDKLTLSGASDAEIGNLKTGNFELRCSGASDVKGIIEAEDVDMNASGASDIKLQLKCKDMSIHCSGASEVKLKGNCQDVDVRCSGASNIKIEGSCNDVSGSCSGASNVDLKGCTTGEVKVSTSGASNVRR